MPGMTRKRKDAGDDKKRKDAGDNGIKKCLKINKKESVGDDDNVIK